MKYPVFQKSEMGDIYKWLPAISYQQSARYLLDQIEHEPQNFDILIIPFILTLGATLEAYLNDLLIMDTFDKHGKDQYKPLADGFIGISFAKKLRVTVAVLTDNAYHLQERSSTTQQLDCTSSEHLGQKLAFTKRHFPDPRLLYFHCQRLQILQASCL